MFCETKRDLLEAVFAYFSPAHCEKEYCLWVVSDPLTKEDAKTALCEFAPEFERRLRAGTFEIMSTADWRPPDGHFDLKVALDTLHDRTYVAKKHGFDGVRVCVNPAWQKTELWKNFAQYEYALENALIHRPIIMLCIYATGESSAEDVLDAASAHQCVIDRRSGRWQFLEAVDAAHANRELKLFNADLDVLPAVYACGGILTDRERVVLAQLIKGAANKQIAHMLGISPRTVEAHRARIMRKLSAKNAADLVRKVLGDS
jgi:DNA-binding CsgD family transcriptional regulator